MPGPTAWSGTMEPDEAWRRSHEWYFEREIPSAEFVNGYLGKRGKNALVRFAYSM